MDKNNDKNIKFENNTIENILKIKEENVNINDTNIKIEFRY
jgi:hypothetical protein